MSFFFFTHSSLVNKFKNKDEKKEEDDEEEMRMMDVYAYTQTCIQLQSDFLSGRLNACTSESPCECVFVCACSVAIKTRQGLLR